MPILTLDLGPDITGWAMIHEQKDTVIRLPIDSGVIKRSTKKPYAGCAEITSMIEENFLCDGVITEIFVEDVLNIRQRGGAAKSQLMFIDGLMHLNGEQYNIPVIRVAQSTIKASICAGNSQKEEVADRLKDTFRLLFKQDFPFIDNNHSDAVALAVTVQLRGDELRERHYSKGKRGKKRG